jgi:hypothetical protein
MLLSASRPSVPLLAATRSSKPSSSMGHDSSPCWLQNLRTPPSMAPTRKAATPARRAWTTQLASMSRNASLANVTNTSAPGPSPVAWRAS